MHTTSALTPLQQAFQHADTQCIQCGFCLPKCPTYRLTHHEAASPRGRIALMQAVADGVLEAGEIATQLDFCLGCRACESACPAGVEFGTLLEAGRAETHTQDSGTLLHTWLRQWILQTLLPSPWFLQRFATLLRMYQVSGIQHILQRYGVWQRLPPIVATLESLLPPIPPAAERAALPCDTLPEGDMQDHVALLTGCIVPVVLPAVNRATGQVLARNGYRVTVPAQQRCCGALQAHAGALDIARELARQHIIAFEATGARWMIVNAAGCGAMMKAYGHLLAADTTFAARAQAFSQRVRDISEVLALTPLRPPLHPLLARVAYDDPCHLLHGQHIYEPPRMLLRQVPALQLLEVPESDWCCGSAGIYNVTHPETANALLDRKMAHLAAVQPDLIVTGNPGCILQLRLGVARHRLAVRVLHPIEVIAQAYTGNPA